MVQWEGFRPVHTLGVCTQYQTMLGSRSVGVHAHIIQRLMHLCQSSRPPVILGFFGFLCRSCLPLSSWMRPVSMEIFSGPSKHVWSGLSQFSTWLGTVVCQKLYVLSVLCVYSHCLVGRQRFCSQSGQTSFCTLPYSPDWWTHTVFQIQNN